MRDTDARAHSIQPAQRLFQRDPVPGASMGRGVAADASADYDDNEAEGGTAITVKGRHHPVGYVCDDFCVFASMAHGGCGRGKV